MSVDLKETASSKYNLSFFNHKQEFLHFNPCATDDNIVIIIMMMMMMMMMMIIIIIIIIIIFKVIFEVLYLHT